MFCFLVLVISHIGFEDKIFVLIVLVPGHYLRFTFRVSIESMVLQVQVSF